MSGFEAEREKTTPMTSPPGVTRGPPELPGRTTACSEYTVRTVSVFVVDVAPFGLEAGEDPGATVGEVAAARVAEDHGGRPALDEVRIDP